VRFVAAASSALRPILAGPPRPAECLGVARSALYLRTADPPGVLAVLCHDAVRLPCGLLLPATTAELPLTSLTSPWPAPSASFVVGEYALSWTGPAGRVVVRVVREWAPARPACGEVEAGALAAVRSRLGLDGSTPSERQQRPIDRWPEGSADRSADARPLADPAAAACHRDASVAAVARLLGTCHRDASVAAARLLGKGPGLTPSGDDVLAGFLVGAAAFGVDAAPMRQAIAVQAPVCTTALSAALLWHAARGECIDELAAVATALTSRPRPGHDEAAVRAVSRLVSVGHTSGAALAQGLVIAAETALRGQHGRAA
jgi:hypothetical protein